jgi:hypothetical protein
MGVVKGRPVPARRDVAKLFRVLQRHLPTFLDMIRYQLTSWGGVRALGRHGSRDARPSAAR